MSNRNRACTRLAAISLFLLLCAISCSTRVVFHLYNGSSRQVLLIHQAGILGERRRSIQSQQSIAFDAVYFSVDREGCLFLYELVELPPREFVGSGIVQRHVYLQLDGDGKIFVLRPIDRPSVETRVYAQPPGFPLVPKIRCEGSHGH